MMPRPAVHRTDVLLDAARAVVIEAGPRGVGIRDIAKRSGAPGGALYHRFGSRDNLLAIMWLRAVRRFQAGFLEALEAEAPDDALRRGARWCVTFALAEPQDTQLLLRFSRADLLDAAPQADVADQLAGANAELERSVRQLAQRLFGTVTWETLERTTYAAIDLPHAVVRRHILAGTLSLRTAPILESAVTTITQPRAGR